MQITLSQLLPEDIPTLALLANNRKIWDNVRDFFPHPYTTSDAEAFIAKVTAEQPQSTFAIRCGGDFCGVTGFIPGTDIHRFNAEIGYWIGEPFWGKGIATEAVRLLTAYGFEQSGFMRLYAGVMAYNTGSMRILEKNGYALEAIFKKGIFKNGVFVDEYQYGRLANDECLI